MSRPPETGVCILSIDLDYRAARLDELRHAISQAGLRVTWGIDAVQAEVFGRQLGQHAADEVALRADVAWGGDGSNRRQFADQLTYHLTQLASGGLHPTTLVLPNGRLAPHDDLLVKNGIQLVRVSQGRPSQASRGWWPKSRATPLRSACTSLRWGLWEVVTTCDLTLTGMRGAQRVVDRVSRHGGLAVVVASAERMVSDRRSAETLINHLGRRHSEGVVRLETLAGLSAELQATRPTATARSILHSVAA